MSRGFEIESVKPAREPANNNFGGRARNAFAGFAVWRTKREPGRLRGPAQLSASR